MDLLLHGICGSGDAAAGLAADRPQARPAAAVRDAEGLVQVQVAHVRTDGA